MFARARLKDGVERYPVHVPYYLTREQLAVALVRCGPGYRPPLSIRAGMALITAAIRRNPAWLDLGEDITPVPGDADHDRYQAALRNIDTWHLFTPPPENGPQP